MISPTALHALSRRSLEQHISLASINTRDFYWVVELIVEIGRARGGQSAKRLLRIKNADAPQTEEAVVAFSISRAVKNAAQLLKEGFPFEQLPEQPGIEVVEEGAGLQFSSYSASALQHMLFEHIRRGKFEEQEIIALIHSLDPEYVAAVFKFNFFRSTDMCHKITLTMLKLIFNPKFDLPGDKNLDLQKCIDACRLEESPCFFIELFSYAPFLDKLENMMDRLIAFCCVTPIEKWPCKEKVLIKLLTVWPEQTFIQKLAWEGCDQRTKTIGSRLLALQKESDPRWVVDLAQEFIELFSVTHEELSALSGHLLLPKIEGENNVYTLPFNTQEPVQITESGFIGLVDRSESAFLCHVESEAMECLWTAKLSIEPIYLGRFHQRIAVIGVNDNKIYFYDERSGKLVDTVTLPFWVEASDTLHMTPSGLFYRWSMHTGVILKGSLLNGQWHEQLKINSGAPFTPLGEQIALDNRVIWRDGTETSYECSQIISHGSKLFCIDDESVHEAGTVDKIPHAGQVIGFYCDGSVVSAGLFSLYFSEQEMSTDLLPTYGSKFIVAQDAKVVWSWNSTDWTVYRHTLESHQSKLRITESFEFVHSTEERLFIRFVD